MKINKIISLLQEYYPQNLASSFDMGKIGLQFGSKQSEIKKIMIALDGTMTVINEAVEKNVDLLITHHPVLFYPMLSFDYDVVFTKKLLKIFDNRLNVYSMHTNFDTAKEGMNDLLAQKLEFDNISIQKDELDSECFLRYGTIEPTTLEEYSKIVMNKLNENGSRIVGNKDHIIKKVAIVGGAGASEINMAIKLGCDCLITGEVKHNQAIDAIEREFSIIELSHSIESIFKEELKNRLSPLLEGVEIIVSENEKDPFWWNINE